LHADAGAVHGEHMLKKVVSILICVLSLFLGAAVAVPENPPADINDLLKKAGDLKVAEKYEAARDLYDRVLELDPENREALRGKDDCRIMLEPVIPEQALVVPFDFHDPEWQKIQKAVDEAKTPWDKRRALLTSKRFARKYTGQVYAGDKEAYIKRADLILQGAAAEIEKGAPRETVCSRTKEKLTVLQEKIHRSWKGHGPDILAPALEKLDKIQKGGGSDSGYRLIKVIKNADLDYGMLHDIDRITPPFPEGGKYQIGDIGTVKGVYTVYKFMREYEGLSGSADKPAPFHDLLVVKVDGAGVIVDAYKYTLEWTDSPSLALYRLGRKGVRFKEDMDVRELQLTK
jgi:tetratricopeptide (TPR) repeat protein